MHRTGYATALTKSVLHGIVRGTINVIQNKGKFISSFVSAFVSSAFSSGRNTFASLGEGAIVARTTVMALVGGVTYELTGGKFGNGAVTAAFVHLFNMEFDFLDKALKGLSNGLNKLGNKSGEIMNDIGKGFNSITNSITKISPTRALSLIGGGLQAGTGIILITTGAGAPLGYWLVTLGSNNIISAVSGYNPMQEAISAATGSEQAGRIIYMTIDLGSSGAALMVKTTRIARTPIGSIMYTQRAYQNMSRGQAGIESLVATGTFYSGTSSK